MELKDEIPIRKVHRIGKESLGDRPMLVKLNDVNDKAKIFKSVSKLKGKQNVKRKLFSVDNDMDPEQAEVKTYYRQLVKENQQLEQHDQLEIKFHQGQVVANNEKIKPQLFALTAARILTTTDTEQQDIRATKLYKGEEFTEKGSDYISYTQKVKTVKDVQKGLYKMKFKYADATHISCAYRLDNAKGPFRQEYMDDEEPGAGRTILQAIKDRGLTGVAVFIIRYYGGIKLGKR